MSVFSKNDPGNVLFLILIAVVLFAALSYAVTSSTRGGGSANRERQEIAAAQIVQFATGLKQAVQRARILNICGESEFDFTNAVYKNNLGLGMQNANGNAPSDGRCDAFSAAGLAVQPFIPPKVARDIDSTEAAGSGWPIPGHGVVRVHQIDGIGTSGASGTVSANDLDFELRYLTKQVCMIINERLGIPNPSNSPPVAVGTGGSDGGYSGGSFTSARIYSDSSINGKSAFCRGTDQSYHFHMVLIER